jgi:hypothetical protein
LSELFEVPVKAERNNLYAGYGLKGNPFKVDETLATLDIGDDDSRFKKMMCALEIERLVDLISDEAYSETPKKLWLKEDHTTAKRFNNVVTTGLFRAMVGTANPRMLPVYIPIPQVMSDFAGNVYNLIIDRMLPRYFKNAAYAFIYQELKRVSGGDPKAGPFNAVELIEQMDATNGLALDEILYGREFVLTEAEEYGVLVEEEEDLDEIIDLEAEMEAAGLVEARETDDDIAEAASAEEQPRNDETTPSEDAVNVTEEVVVEEEPADPRRDAILAFAARRLNDPSLSFGNTLKMAIQTGLGDSFVKARIILQQANSPKDELLGLLRLICRYYNGVVVFIDQLDPWVMFTDAEKIQLLSSIHEFDLMSGGRAVLTSVSNAEVYMAFDERYLKECETIPLNLSWMSQNVEEIAKDKASRLAVVSAFIEKAGGKGPGPFTADGIDAVFDAAGGEVCPALDRCGELLEAGSKNGFPPIDGAFAKRQA